MVVLSRRGVALLAIAACATTALAAEGPYESSPEVAAEVMEQPSVGESIFSKRGVSGPVIAGTAAVGTALMAAILLFGIKVLGAKLVQTESKIAHSKVAEEILALTDKMTVTTEDFAAYVKVKFENKAKEAIKTLEEAEKAMRLDEMSSELRRVLDTIKAGGTGALEFIFGEGKVSVDVELKPTPPQEPQEPQQPQQPQ
ncbi:hypothetical protein, conserved [Eimeria maxima]|uniref:Uncharacterized protein n=1 Tax=Eimeria maxima TaxID=5804 RepID=U6M6H9_EIMMA|nr:hypothetical protein, conserved [Eimeria maxima]CDJ57285.1 hypothetical protein, conserved [Eimeria maxima]